MDRFSIHNEIYRCFPQNFTFNTKPTEIRKAQAQISGCLGSHNNFVTSANLNKHYQDKMTV